MIGVAQNVGHEVHAGPQHGREDLAENEDRHDQQVVLVRDQQLEGLDEGVLVVG